MLNQNFTIQVNLLSSYFLGRFEVGSLNRDRRKKELVKITIEN